MGDAIFPSVAVSEGEGSFLYLVSQFSENFWKPNISELDITKFDSNWSMGFKNIREQPSLGEIDTSIKHTQGTDTHQTRLNNLGYY